MTAINAPALEYGSDVPMEEEKPLLSVGAVERPRWMPLWFMPSAMFGAFSWVSGGIQTFNDFAMVLFFVMCVIGLIREFKNFKVQQGMGGLVLFGGAINWFCHDYFANWFGPNFGEGSTAVFSPSHADIAKGITLVSLFMISACLGLKIKKGKRIEKIMASVPEPARNTYLIIVVCAFILGLIPYILFNNDPFFVAVWKDMSAMRSGEGSSFTFARTGNLNYNWGAYLKHLGEIGQVGAILGACYVMIYPTNAFTKILCLSMWLFHVGLAFGTGSRGPLLAMGLPVISATVLRAWIYSAAGKRALVTGVVMMGFLLAAAQYQGTYRTVVWGDRDVGEMKLFKSQGNKMFSEPLLAYNLVPGERSHPGDRFPGATLVRPLPEWIYRFGTGWIPRALWNNKPDSFMQLIGASPDFRFALFYNEVVTGGQASNDESGNQTGGGTVAWSVVGMGYIPYGISGVIQYGILFGWLCAISERVLKRSGGRLMALLFAMGFATYLFRAFRDLTPHDLYPLLIGTVAISFMIKMIGAQPKQPQPDEDEGQAPQAG